MENSNTLASANARVVVAEEESAASFPNVVLLSLSMATPWPSFQLAFINPRYAAMLACSTDVGCTRRSEDAPLLNACMCLTFSSALAVPVMTIGRLHELVRNRVSPSTRRK